MTISTRAAATSWPRLLAAMAAMWITYGALVALGRLQRSTPMTRMLLSIGRWSSTAAERMLRR